jgi:glycerol uptake facilitator-like aquaporin
MQQEAWAALFLVTGVLQLSIVAMEDFHGRFARYFAAWNMSLWVFVVGSCFLSVSPPPAAMSGELILAAGAFWVWFRPFVIYKGIIHARSQRD